MSTQAWPILIDRLGRATGHTPCGISNTVACRCPAHGDTNPSLSAKLCQDGRILLYCFSGCAVEDIVARLGLEMRDLMPDDLGTRRKATPRPATVDTPPVLPGDLSVGTGEDRRQLAQLRNLNVEAVQIAVDRGLIRFGTYKGARCWFILDGTMVNVQARQLDGNKFGD